MADIIKVELPWVSQPQEAAEVSDELELSTLLAPAPGGKFREVLGPAWTYNNTANLSSGAAAFGRAVVNASTGYLSRTSPYTSGAVTVGLIFTPSTISGDEGIWSIADTAASGGPHFLIQRNGANLRILWGGAYNISPTQFASLTGIFAVGKQMSIVVSFSDISLSAGINCVVHAGINGAVYTATAVQNTAAVTNEFFMSGFNGQADGAYGEMWSTPRALGPKVGVVSANQWQYIYAPQIILLPVSAAGGSTGTVAYTNANDTGSASGTTTVTGTLAKSNASDTSAASGTTTVLGTLAKSSADDTAAASGSVGSGVSGTVAYTNVDDTSAAAGTTTVTGTVARSNLDDSVSASGWAGLISGTVSVSNANDTASASGDAGAAVVAAGGRGKRSRRLRFKDYDVSMPPEVLTSSIPSDKVVEPIGPQGAQPAAVEPSKLAPKSKLATPRKPKAQRVVSVAPVVQVTPEQTAVVATPEPEPVVAIAKPAPRPMMLSDMLAAESMTNEEMLAAIKMLARLHMGPQLVRSPRPQLIRGR